MRRTHATLGPWHTHSPRRVPPLLVLRGTVGPKRLVVGAVEAVGYPQSGGLGNFPLRGLRQYPQYPQRLPAPGHAR